jgi:hypothetical protein
LNRRSGQADRVYGYEYDALGRKTRLKRPNGAQPVFDADGNPLMDYMFARAAGNSNKHIAIKED